MKKALLSAAGIGAIIIGVGYFVSVQKFAAEAENFKESVAQSSVFKVNSINVDKYKFQIKLDGISINIANALPDNKDLKEKPIIQLDVKGAFDLQYMPLLNKLTILDPKEGSQLVFNVAGVTRDFIVKEKSGATILELSQVPSFKDMSFGNFLVTYVKRIYGFSEETSFVAKDSTKPILAMDSFEQTITYDKIDDHHKLSLITDVKGGIYDSSEILKLLPAEITSQVGFDKVMSLYAPYTQLSTEKRDSTGQISVEGRFSDLIDFVKSGKEVKGNEVEFMKALQGFSVSVDSKQIVLGSTIANIMKLVLPKTDKETTGELKYRIATTVSSEMQAIIPKIIYDNIKLIVPESPLTEQAVADLTPDFKSLGQTVFDLEANGDYSKMIGKASLEISMAPYGIFVNAEGNQNNIVAKMTIKNYEEMLKDLEAYVTKVSNHPAMATLISPEFKQQLPAYATMATTALKSMGKEQDINGKKSLIIEQTIPTGMLTGMAQGMQAQGASANASPLQDAPTSSSIYADKPAASLK